jgi:hypothetical protein
MQPVDFLRAARLGIGVLLATLLASIPMVAVYAYVINPGQPQAVYDAAARWIAPWSSHIIGPLLFLWFNYRGAVRHPTRQAIPFALAGMVGYVIADLASVPVFGLTFASVLTGTFFRSLAVKTAAALLGAHLGARRSSPRSAPPPTGARSHG